MCSARADLACELTIAASRAKTRYTKICLSSTERKHLQWNLALSRTATLTHIKAAEIHGIRLGVIVRFTDINMEACTTGSRFHLSSLRPHDGTHCMKGRRKVDRHTPQCRRDAILSALRTSACAFRETP